MDGQLGMDGVCMGIMEHGGMALKHSSQNFPCFGGWYVSGLELPGIKTHAKPPIET